MPPPPFTKEPVRQEPVRNKQMSALGDIPMHILMKGLVMHRRAKKPNTYFYR